MMPTQNPMDANASIKMFETSCKDGILRIAPLHHMFNVLQCRRQPCKLVTRSYHIFKITLVFQFPHTMDGELNE
jgi:hypothetical protein